MQLIWSIPNSNKKSLYIILNIWYLFNIRENSEKPKQFVIPVGGTLWVIHILKLNSNLNSYDWIPAKSLPASRFTSLKAGKAGGDDSKGFSEDSLTNNWDFRQL